MALLVEVDADDAHRPRRVPRVARDVLAASALSGLSCSTMWQIFSPSPRGALLRRSWMSV